MVLDTDVVVAALRSPTGGSAALLRLLRQGQGTMLISTALLLEYEAVCMRPLHRTAAGLSAIDVQSFIDGLAVLAEPVPVHFHWRPQLLDPGDEMVLEAAVNGRADAIVAFNLRDYGDVPRRFGLLSMRPADALGRIVQ
ncbi:MAG TPA: putative toxin-antitoxin system toxin component, PIN family [Rhodopila sp.]|uniref:putative toxin-antitoxin system toxin component, PIN family n=1 Tax=Rhodopila sp. TaxID=2480087 RepID=UPI002C585F6D|nr:putative toxin-antitoxin system toxin component, PIN family [Rhodopila sp.]HVY18292.1 putative toxin-antitoxin system toxin component, PIN family [Rhodopila sp.]